MKALGALEGVVTLLAIALVAFLAFKVFKFGKNVGDTINSGVNSTVRTLTGGAENGGEDTLGGVAARIREKLSGDDARINAMKTGSNPSPFVGNVGIPSDLDGAPFIDTPGGAAVGMRRKP